MIIRLYEEWSVRHDIHQKILSGIHNNADILLGKPFHDALIDIIWKGIRDAACQHQSIIFLQLVQLLKQLLLSFRRNIRALAVDFSFFVGLNFYIDAGEALCQADKILLYAESLQLTGYLVAGKACSET